MGKKLRRVAARKAPQYTIEDIRLTAKETNLIEIYFNEKSALISFLSQEYNCRINVYYTTGTVGTCLLHPKSGKTQLFRPGEVTNTLAKLKAIFQNPRLHTGKGYYYKKRKNCRKPSVRKVSFVYGEVCNFDGNAGTIDYFDPISESKQNIQVLHSEMFFFGESKSVSSLDLRRSLKDVVVNQKVRFSIGIFQDKPAAQDVTRETGDALIDNCFSELPESDSANKGWKSRNLVDYKIGKKRSGTRPPHRGAPFPNPHPYYPIPTKMKRLAKDTDVHKFNHDITLYLERRNIQPVNADLVDKTKYRRTLNQLLFVEEIESMMELSLYDIESTHLSLDPSNRHLHILKVRGLAERRPSVLRGDTVFLKQSSTGILFQGYVYFVNMDDLRISLPKSFNARSEYHVHFACSRNVFRAQHRAVDTVPSNLLDCVLQTAESLQNVDQVISTEETLVSLPSLPKYFQTSLNEEQKQAVQLVLKEEDMRSKIMVIWGPPGTGKTFTLVESILQILQQTDNAKLLVCAPSNDAVDILCSRVLSNASKLSKAVKFFRLNAMMRDPKLVPADVREVSSYSSDAGFIVPSLKDLSGIYDVIFATCASSSYLQSQDLPPNFFTHILIDEAAQATEPEIFIPLYASINARVIFAGDPKQLGPIIRSSVCKSYGLQNSILERFIEGGINSTQSIFPVVMLVNNYRSHPSIVKLFSQIFYDDKLIPHVDPMMSMDVLQWSGWKNKTPILFQHVEGIEARDRDSPSWYNSEEKECVVRTVEDLILQHNMEPSDIGIITPYLKQVQKIKGTLHNRSVTGEGHYFDYKRIKVGTVESFQGDEKKIIVISSVRSSARYLSSDAKFCLGFLKNFRRLNVAISRPRSGLIIIGNSKLLATDVTWRTLIQFCIQNECLSGIDENEIDDLCTSFKNLEISPDLDITGNSIDDNSEYEEVVLSDAKDVI